MTQVVVDFRFGDKYWVTEFVQPKTFEVYRLYENLKTEDNDQYVKNVADHIRDNYQYPFDSSGKPSASAQLLLFQIGWGRWHFKRCVEYHWNLVSETIVSRKGICIDSSILCTSLLRAKPVPAWVVIGAVKKLDDTILGYHAWTDVWYRDDWWLVETTIHEPKINNMILSKEAYNKNSSTAQKLGFYYQPMARFNEQKYEELEKQPFSLPPTELLRLPPYWKEKPFLEALPKLKPKKLYKLWKEAEIKKVKLVTDSFSKL